MEKQLDLFADIATTQTVKEQTIKKPSTKKRGRPKTKKTVKNSVKQSTKKLAKPKPQRKKRQETAPKPVKKVTQHEVPKHDTIDFSEVNLPIDHRFNNFHVASESYRKHYFWVVSSLYPKTGLSVLSARYGFSLNRIKKLIQLDLIKVVKIGRIYVTWISKNVN